MSSRKTKVHHIATPLEEDRATAIENMCQKIGGFPVVRVDRQTDKQKKNIHITILHTPPDLWCFDFWQYQISLLMQLKAFRSPTWLWRGWCEDCLILLVACSATSGPPILQHQARLGLCFRSRYSYWHTRLLASVYNRFWSNAAVFLCQIELSACYRKLAYLPPYQMTQVDSVLFNLQITEINSFT